MAPRIHISTAEGITSTVHHFLRALPDATVNEPTLVARQDASPATVTVYINQGGGGGGGGNDLTGGEIAGIVIGSVVGFILLMWLIFRCTGGRGPGEPPRRDSAYYHHEEPKYRQGGSRHRSRHSHSRRRSGSIHAPPPVVIREYSRGPSRGRSHSRGY